MTPLVKGSCKLDEDILPKSGAHVGCCNVQAASRDGQKRLQKSRYVHVSEAIVQR